MGSRTLTKKDIRRYEKQLLSYVPDDRNIGNNALRNKLQWSDDDLYWRIRNGLIDNGQLEKGRGKGGSVQRVVQVIADVEMDPSATTVQELKENSYYQPIRNVIEGKWAKDARVDSVIAEVTAQQGRKITGKWTRPDITVATLKTFPYISGKQIEISVFEVKPQRAADVTAVYEALGHRRAANRAYVIVVSGDGEQDSDREEVVLDEICSEARKFGIGVIVASDASNYESWAEREEATRHEPDPERMNDFIAQQVSQDFRDKLMKWFK